MSPAVGAPLISTSSAPASPSMTSVPSPLFQTSTSLPTPPSRSSVPLKPMTRSLPPSPRRSSLPDPPVSRSSPIATVDGERGVIGRRERARVDGVGAIACVDDDLGVAVGGEGRRLTVDRDDPAGGGEGDRVGRLIARHRQGVGVHGLGDRGAGAGRCSERGGCYGGDQRRCLRELAHEIPLRFHLGVCIRARQPRGWSSSACPLGRPPVMLGMANVVVRRQPSSGRAGSLNASPCLRAMSRSLAVIAAIICPNGTPHIGHIP